jgi:lysozyme
MEYTKNGLHLTEHFEGCRLSAYPDPGSGGDPWTIGYGHTGPEVHPGLVITLEQAEQYLMEDVQKAAADVNARVKIELTQDEFNALVDFAFNCGCGNLNNSTLLKKLNAGDIQGAAEEFLKWDMAAGKHLAGLAKRREAEKELFLGDENAIG